MNPTVDNLWAEFSGPNGAEYGALLWRFLNDGSARWVFFEYPDGTAVESRAFHRLILAGQVQMRQRMLARGLQGEPEVEVTVVYTGDCSKILINEIRSVVPEFSGKVIVKPQKPMEYRLSEAGLNTQKELRLFGGGPVEEAFLAESFKFSVPGIVNIVDVRYIKQGTAVQPVPMPVPVSDNHPAVATPTSAVPTTPAPSVATTTTPAETAPVASAPAATVPATTTPATVTSAAGKKSPKLAAWPVGKTERYVTAYLAKEKNLYIKMARDVLDELAGAVEAFRKTFGSTAIAEVITQKVGTKIQRACSKKDVDKTHTYKSRVQPLLRRTPQAPDRWAEMLADWHGEDVDELAAEIPFAEDDSSLDDVEILEMRERDGASAEDDESSFDGGELSEDESSDEGDDEWAEEDDSDEDEDDDEDDL